MKTLPHEDAFFIYAETPEQHQHTLGVLLLDPSTAGEDFSIKSMIDKMELDLEVLPEFRQKLSDLPNWILPPTLVDDPNFHYRNHVKHIALPEPGTMKQLCEVISDISSVQLDRRRPLWETTFVEGLEDGRVAVVSKSHHCIADGVQGAEFMAEQFDFEPNPPKKERSTTAWEPQDLSFFKLASGAWLGNSKTRSSLTDMAKRSIRSVRARRKLSKEQPDVAALVPDAIPSAPALEFNGRITPNRSVALGALPLEDLKSIKDSLGVKLNDVVLALCTQALREYLVSIDDLPDEPLVCAVPVSMALKGKAAGDAGNQVGNMMVALPVNIGDPAQCLQQIHKNTLAAKKVFEEAYEGLMNGYIGLLPPVLADTALSTLFGSAATSMLPTSTNVTISNFPGPPLDLYMSGARLDGTVPIGPVIAGQGLNMTFMSGLRNLDYSVHTCREKLGNPWAIADGIEKSLKAYLKIAKGTTKPPATKQSAAKKAPAKKAPSKKVAAKKAAPKKVSTKKAPAKKVAAASTKDS